MTVYDGSDNQADKLINQVSSSDNNGELTDIPTVTSTGKSMTFYFHSNNSESDNSEFHGLNLTVTLIYNLNETDGITDAINEELKGKTVNIAFCRTFEPLSSGDGNASTLCLPFDLAKPSTTTDDTSGWQFIGTYQEKTWTGGETRLYGFATSNFEKSRSERASSQRQAHYEGSLH